ncbi:MAG: hypothetical protein GH145_02560 [Firmicutes bacterium]|nr:hypothetical protein [Bacillota bacterium]
MEKEKKKKWETPKLICLYRGRPEEAVLTGCKVTGGATGPNGFCVSGSGPKCDRATGT